MLNLCNTYRFLQWIGLVGKIQLRKLVGISPICPPNPQYIYVYNYINNVSCRLPLKPLYWILVFVSSLRDLNVRRCPKGIRVAELKMGTVVEPTNMVI
jgi:hypothetical protein